MARSSLFYHTIIPLLYVDLSTNHRTILHLVKIVEIHICVWLQDSKMLKDEWLSKGRPQSDAGNITWSAQDERKEMLHKIRRNWCLPIGQVFDMRAPDAWGEKWDFSRRADRRFAWRELAKEESILAVVGDPVAHRGQGDHRRFCNRICLEQAREGRYFVQEGSAGTDKIEGDTVRGRSNMWVTNSIHIASELAKRKRGVATTRKTT